jgi:hypothetical protein
VSEGDGNEALYMLAVQLKKAGMGNSEIEATLTTKRSTQTPEKPRHFLGVR